jgi:hypothetical protein
MVGIAIASSITNPEIAVPLAFCMHFVGDLVPHWDFSNTEENNMKQGWVPIAVFADMILGVALGVTFTLYALWVLHNSALALRIFLCGVASVLPDAITAPAIYSAKANIISRIFYKVQGKLQFKAGPLWGNLTQLLVIAVAFLAISNSLSL